MKNIFNRISALTVCLCLVAVIAGGCSTIGRTARLPNNQRGTANPNTGINMGQAVRQNTNPRTGTTADISRLSESFPQQSLLNDRKRADDIRAQLSNLRELDRVNVVVSGNRALVGVLRSSLSKDRNAAKSMVVNKVKQTDRNIKEVIVGDSHEIYARVQQLANDVTYNKPLDSITSSFNQIVQSIKSDPRK